MIDPLAVECLANESRRATRNQKARPGYETTKLRQRLRYAHAKRKREALPKSSGPKPWNDDCEMTLHVCASVREMLGPSWKQE